LTADGDLRDVSRTLHGVDFSGARQAGHHLWFADATVDDDGLRIDDVGSAADRFGVAERGPCLGQLCEFVRSARVVGFDFPFGLPRAVHDAETWSEFLQWFPTAPAFSDPDAFEAACKERAEAASNGERTYLKRVTDEPVGALSPYDVRVKAQTFYGVRDLLARVATGDAVTVQPMDEGDGTQVCEVYPAATLATLDLPAREYKDEDERARDRRRTIVEGLATETPIRYADGVRGVLVDDAGGDAIDSVVAALATYRAAAADFEPDRESDPVEGHVFV
jgi:predicted nuclease with RNAse H fold